MKYEDFVARFEKKTKTANGFVVRCPAHDDGRASLSVGKSHDGGVVLKCFAGCTALAVVTALGLTMKDLFATSPAKQFTAPAPRQNIGNYDVKSVIDRIYSYTDAQGRELYQVCRMKPKDFRQRHQGEKGWIWNMENVDRVLFRLPEVVKSDEVWIVEGEKDAENLSSAGFCATCNVGGAGKWLDGYTEALAGKAIVICGDNDDAGRKHVEIVFESLAPKARNIRIVKLPESIKDASDYLATFNAPELAHRALEELRDAAALFIAGKKLPLYSMFDLEARYKRFVSRLAENSFDLGRWLPTLGLNLRPLVAGELAFIIGDTGTGKTGLLQMIAKASRPLPALLFELELPAELLFERSLASMTPFTCREIEDGYRSGDEALSAALDGLFPNLLICTESRLTIGDIEEYVLRSELRLGQKPKLVLIDYIQLIKGAGERRERVSDIAEALKVMAKATQTIVIVTSQVARTKDENPLPTLHSAKESGSIEASCGLLLGAWREDSDTLKIKVLKSTKGGAGTIVTCNFDGPGMKITERSRED